MGFEDNFYKYLNFYKKSPRWIRRIVGSVYASVPYQMRYGRNFQNFIKVIEESKYWSSEEHRAYQEKKIRQILLYVCNNVSYYKKKYLKMGVHPDDFKKLEDIKKFPFITREEIQKHFKQFVSSQYSKKHRLYVTTSGSSGTPLQLYYQKGVTRSKERAFVLDMWGSVGYQVRDKIVCFRGEVIADGAKPWYYDPIDRQLNMSSYLLDEKRISSYCRQIRKFKPTYLRGYPFTVFQLVNLMQQNGEPPFQIKGVILESENVYKTHTSFIKGYMRCPVYHSYGHAERLVTGGICINNDSYHIYPEYGYLELIKPDGNNAGKGEKGEIIATGFDNLVMPLVRYRTRDFAVFGGNYCQECRKNYFLLEKVEGREEEYVYLTDNSKVPFHNLLAGLHGKQWASVKRIQCVQNEKGHIIINIVPWSNKSRYFAGEIFSHEIKARVDKMKLTIEVNFTDTIPVTATGKTKLFIQNILD